VSVVYEVNLSVDATIAEDYAGWLHAHVAQMLALPGFVDASMWQVLEPAPAPGQIQWCVHYRLVDRPALDAYLAEHAPRMRADGMARFGGRFQATRRILGPG
jgi:hypothetical protein